LVEQQCGHGILHLPSSEGLLYPNPPPDGKLARNLTEPWEGGMVGGAPGIDTNLVRLTRGEGVLNLRAMQGIGEPALNYMNSTGRLPAANDNGNLVAAINRRLPPLSNRPVSS
jgi:hypothetical protein